MNKSRVLKNVQLYLWAGAAGLLLWILYDLLNYPRNFQTYMLNDLWHAPYLLVINFIFFEYSLPLTRKKRWNIFYNILAGIILIALHLILLSFGLYCWTQLGFSLHVYSFTRHSVLIPGGFYQTLLDQVFYLAQSGIASTVFFGIAYLVHNNFRLKLVAQQQQTEMREAELAYLKSQTNPHFLFNTLNNIYGLATEKSDLTAESILRLSKILRFMLYETGEKYITLEQELDIIRDYIALEQLRYDDSLEVKFICEVEDAKVQLRPLLMVPLVENAFKHGASEDTGDPFIDIHTTVKDSQLKLTVKNSSENPGKANMKENIGLANLRRQLQLLYTDYELSVQQGQGVFTARLRINLSSDIHDQMHHNRG